MNRSLTIAGISAIAAIASITGAFANTYAGNDWTLNYNLNGQIELSDSFIDFSTGNVTANNVVASDIVGGANLGLNMPFFNAIDMYEEDSNSNFTVGDVGDKLRRVYGDDMAEAPILVDGSTLAWMNPLLANYDLEITEALLTSTIKLKSGARVYDLRDGKGFVLSGMAWAKEGTDVESGSFTASSKFNLTRPVPEPSTVAGLLGGLTSLVSLRARRRK